MIFIWNIISTLTLLITWPILCLWAIIGKHGLKCRLGFVPVCDGDCIWIHSASVGEAGVAVTLREIITGIKPDAKFFFSATTRTGATRLKSMAHTDDKVCVLPVDSPIFTAMAMKRANPEVLIIVETEFWPNLLLLAKRRGIPIILANGRLTSTTQKYARLFPKTFRKIAACFGLYLMKSRRDAENLLATGIETSKIRTLGNLKFGGSPGEIQTIKIERKPVIVAGSVRPGELPELIETIKSVKKKYLNVLFVIAPRHLGTLQKFKKAFDENNFLYKLKSESPEIGEIDIFILDTIGDLLDFYAAADIAFVGGTLVDYGGHNPLEPAYLGKPVLFGPHYQANLEAYEALIETGGGKSVFSGAELADAIIGLLDNPEKMADMGDKAKLTIEKMREIPSKYESVIREFLSETA